MANTTSHQNAAKFYITLRDDIDYLDEKHTIFGQVEEGLDVLEKINDAYTNSEGVPFQDIRIHHTIILDDPFPDPDRLEVPDASPMLTKTEEDEDFRTLGEDEEVLVDDDPSKEGERQEKLAQKAAQSRAEILEMIGDLPSANVKPPEHVLFVCKLNPVTKEDDLEIIFGKFGKIKSCEIIRDRKSGDSLQYAFIEFSTKEECELAYLKMDNVLIDDRRIHVDFSQSVSKAGKYSKGFNNFMDRGKPSQHGSERKFDNRHSGDRYNDRYSDKHNDRYNDRQSDNKGTKRHRSRSRDREKEKEKHKEREREKERGRDRDRSRR